MKEKTKSKLHVNDLDARYLDIANLDWEPSAFDGIQTKILYSDSKSGMSTIMFKMAPGAVVPTHVHTALEQTYMIEGSLEDEQGVVSAGNFVWRPAGNTHKAWAPNGALFLSFFMKPNRFMDGHSFFTNKDDAVGS